MFRKYSWQSILHNSLEKNKAIESEMVENPDAFLHAEHSFAHTQEIRWENRMIELAEPLEYSANHNSESAADLRKALIEKSLNEKWEQLLDQMEKPSSEHHQNNYLRDKVLHRPHAG